MRRTISIVGALLVLTSCAQQTPAPTPATTPAAATTTTPATTEAKPSSPAFKLTGDFERDLARRGIYPDDLDDYRAHMDGIVCDTPLDGDWPLAKRIIIPAHDPHGPDGMRVIAAYDCPDRVIPLEDALGAIGK